MPRMNLVRCLKCNEVIGADQNIKFIEECNSCHNSKTKVKANKNHWSKSIKGSAKELPSPYNKFIFRSLWERNIARWLCLYNREWTYEQRTFSFSGYDRKPFQYLPDFHLTKDNTFYEVKGYLNSAGRSKIIRFRKVYPEEFKLLKAIVSKNNKKGILFFKNMDIPILFYEDIKLDYKKRVSDLKVQDNWED